MNFVTNYRKLRRATPTKERNKRPDNEFKVRHCYKNVLNSSTFKIVKKFWLDIDWAYKIRYDESGNEHIYTEKQLRAFLKSEKIKRLSNDKQEEHFCDDTLFEL